MIVKPYDFVFLGGGPGGYTGALHAAQAGCRVAVIEREEVGGTCLNMGCIPSKAWLATAAVSRQLQSARRFGFTAGDNTFDYAKARKRVDQVVASLRKGIAETLFPHYGVELIRGEGRLVAGAVEVCSGERVGTVVQAQTIVLAMGSRELIPGWFGGPVEGRVTSREGLWLEALPKKVLIIGGGVIGCEFASFWTDLGVEVTLVEMLHQLLPGADNKAAELLRKGLARRKVRVLTDTKVTELHGTFPEHRAILAGPEGATEWQGDTVLLSIGRIANTDQAGLSEAGLLAGPDGRLPVDLRTRMTAIPGVYACGDLTEGPMLAHKASHEAVYIVDTVLGRERKPLDWRLIPMCVYTEPEVAWVGAPASAGTSASIPVAASGRAKAEAAIEGFIRAVVDPTNGTVIGCQAVGEHASEMIFSAALSLAAGLNAQDWLCAIAPHPTRSELFAEAVAFAATGHAHSI